MRTQRILFICLDFLTWQRAKNWSYTVQLALEEGFHANGVTVVTVPSIHEIPADSKASFLSYIADICKIMPFDQVWIELVHNNINDHLLSFLAKSIPVRVGIVAESLQYNSDAYLHAPELLHRRSQVLHRLQFMTHTLLVDEADEADINANSSIKALWWPQSVPSQFIVDNFHPPKLQQATFGGEIYGDRSKWLDSPLLHNLLIKLPSAEQGTNLPQQFDHLNVLIAEILLKNQRLNIELLTKYAESLRTIRQQSFKLWLSSLQTGNAVVNLPSFFQGYAGRVFEGMAAGRTVISWHVSNRPRTCALFTDQQEILLFPKERPDVLAESIRKIQTSPEFGYYLAENACSKIRRLHTTEIRTRQILEWIESGIYPEYSPTEKTVRTTFAPQRHYTIFPESRHAHAWLDGLSGLEIGPSTHNPFGLTTRNVGMQDNTYKEEQLRLTDTVAELHIEARADNIPLPDESEDFILSSHVIEHCPNLIKTLLEWFRIIKKNGLIYMIVPHRDAAPSDIGRPLTDWQHVYEDFIAQADEYSEPESGRFGLCHYHVFDTLSMSSFIEQVFGSRLTLVDKLELDDKLGNGFTLVYRKVVSNYELEHWQYWELFRKFQPLVAPDNSNKKIVNIGMITYNRLEFTRQSLDAILLNTDSPFTLTIIDNASTDGTKEYLQEQKSRGIIKNLVLLDENVGVARATNLAWSLEPKADYMMRVDNDIVIQKDGWLKAMVDIFEQTKELGVLGYNFEPVSYPLVWLKNGSALRPKNGNIGGGCMMISRPVFEKLGYLCEDYGLYGEDDADYGMRVMVAGMLNAYMPDEDIGLHLPGGKAAVIDPLTLLSSDSGEDDNHAEYRAWKDELRRMNVLSGQFPKNLEKYVQTDGIYYLDSPFVTGWHNKQGDSKACTIDPDKQFLSIIIPAFNQAALTRKCLSALISNLHEDAEIIVIDNGSTDWTPEYLASMGSKIRVTSNNTNLGFARACNQGAAVATGRYLVFLNNDTVPQPGWLNALVSPALDGKAEIVGARLLYPDSTIQHAGVVFDEQGPFHCFKRMPADSAEANQPRYLQAVTAACMLVTAELFRKLGSFDEGYKNGFEDIDFCLNAIQQGYRVFYQPDSVLIHHEESSQGRKQHDEKNYERFLRRWHGQWQIDHQTDKPQVSVIIPVFNQLAYTRKCLETLFITTQELSASLEIIVVDNGSKDGTAEYLKALEPKIRLLFHPQNIGFAKGCNSGAQVAQGRYLVFLNNDTEPCSGWLEALLSVFNGHQKIGIVGSKLLFPDGTIQHAGVAIVRDPYLGAELSPCHVGYQHHDAPEYNQLHECQAVTAACCMIERSLFTQTGGFDEGYWNGFEDVDLCFKVHKAGYRVVYQPESVVIHHESKSGSERKRSETENLNRLQKRWTGNISPEYVRVSPERVERITQA